MNRREDKRQTIDLHDEAAILATIVDGRVDEFHAQRDEGAARLGVRVELEQGVVAAQLREVQLVHGDGGSAWKEGG